MSVPNDPDDITYGNTGADPPADETLSSAEPGLTPEEIRSWSTVLQHLRKDVKPEALAAALQESNPDVLIGKLIAVLANALQRKHPGPVEDAVFHAEIERLQRLVVWLVNYLFGTTYTGGEQVVLGNTETSETDSEGDIRTIRADSYFTIITDDGSRDTYHIEFHQRKDGTIMIRLVEYDLMLALGKPTVEGNTVHVHLPNSALILLRSAPEDSEHWKYAIHSGKRTLIHDVPTLYMSKISVDDIFTNRLFALLPFYLFTYGERLKTMMGTPEGRDALVKEELEILDRLMSAQDLTGGEKIRLREMTANVVKSLVKNPALAQEMEDIMLSRAMKLEVDEIGKPYFDEGQTKGQMNTLFSLVRKGLLKLHDAAEEANMSVEAFEAALEQSGK